jgi:hypothetical protein
MLIYLFEIFCNQKKMNYQNIQQKLELVYLDVIQW